MTTIAANRTSMAADSKVTDGDVSFRTDKIFLVGDALVGMCGRADDTNQFLEWYRDGSKPGGPDFGKHSFAALVLDHHGLYYYSGCIPPDLILDPYYAIGSGALAAMAVMALGHSPENAVATTCKVHNASGGPVKVLYLGTKPEPKRRKRA